MLEIVFYEENAGEKQNTLKYKKVIGIKCFDGKNDVKEGKNDVKEENL